MKKRKPHAPIFFSNFKNPILKFKLEPIFEQIQKEFQNLTVELKWNQPMFIMNGTFIIGFSVAKNHISIAPEAVTMAIFTNDIKAASYEATNNLFKIM
ncbi:iron chaperone [Streptococcus parasuis]|uniref:iron chaperone n=1 Tax=Streptococcus parasuis TaxID=1501662 RepID=UPI001C2CC133|nr:iron chaperone [Streptococcus parasuis]MBV1944252.1 iron chaperone [Streptococcus parasuis]QXF05304.1 iron chaperone [Streptococcus parasuis]